MESLVAIRPMKNKHRVLVVDDDVRILRLLAIRLERAGYEVLSVETGKQAIASIPQFRPHAVVTDVRMDGMDGLTLFNVIHNRQPTLPVIILTAHGTIPDAVAATSSGVFAYLTKPFNGEELLGTLDKAIGSPTPTVGLDDLDLDDWRRDIITRSPAMEVLLAETLRVAKSEASVLIAGESGTGKELIARAIHRAGERSQGPFIAVNCSAIPENLFESELFGHRKGSFTGATEHRRGLMTAADGGTLLLDEIGDMPLPVQAKLLRALQEREIRPVGETQSTPIDIRVISATHHDLEQLVRTKKFREDLYYRLNIVTLDIPTLAERREDIALLANGFLAESVKQRANAREVTGFSDETLDVLVGAAWPGNVRQLRNVVEQCVVLTSTPLIPASLVRRALRLSEKDLLPFAQARDQFEFDYLVNLMLMSEGNVARAARLAERNLSEIYKLMRRHKLDPAIFRQA